MDWSKILNARTLTGGALVCTTLFGVGLVEHYWTAFLGADAVGGGLLVAIAASLAVIEVLMLPVATDRLRKGLVLQGIVWLAIFAAVVTVSATAEYGAISSITSADHRERAQVRYIYDQQQADLQRIDSDVAAARRRLDADNLNIPSAALAAELAAQQEVARRYKANGAEPPASLVRRAAKLDSARITVEEIDRKIAERDALSSKLRDREAAPEAELPQFVTVGRLLGWSPEQVRATLPAILVAVLKFLNVFGFWVIAREDKWDGRRRSADNDNEGASSPQDGDDADALDDGMDARNEAADSRAAPPPPDAQPGRRRSEPVGDGDGDIFDQFNDLYDQ